MKVYISKSSRKLILFANVLDPYFSIVLCAFGKFHMGKTFVLVLILRNSFCKSIIKLCFIYSTNYTNALFSFS